MGPGLEFCLPQSLSEKGQITRKYEQRIPVFFFFFFFVTVTNRNQNKKYCERVAEPKSVTSRIRATLVSPRPRSSEDSSEPRPGRGGGEGPLEHLGRCQARGEHPLSVTACHKVWKHVKPKHSRWRPRVPGFRAVPRYLHALNRRVAW